ncbi:MAG: Na/Pi symporter, partial [Gammaproteobacteria bacterium]|nr:Na/Pi symporter [Gammaproteobacteria bacterium]
MFLLGMIIMTGGLKSLAGDYMRAVIMRFTHNPATGAVTGAVTTAVLQSSSATTVAAVGFVGTGLLTFSESLGIIFGANIGTTITGWLVVLLGFKLDLANVMLPVILLGVVFKLFGNKKLAMLGLSLAGFALIFVGIGLMQTAMTSVSEVITPDVFPDSSWSGRLQLFLLGVVITVITQSSSAGVAIALTALFAGAVEFEQAAAIVIGMDVGTTSTAALAVVGGNVSAKRTGLSHVIYNLMTGCGALLLLSPYIYLWEAASATAITENAELALVAFHSVFNVLGVLLILPFVSQFSNLVKKLIAEKESPYTSGLDNSLLRDNAVAIAALSASMQRETLALLRHLRHLLGDVRDVKAVDLEELQQALNTTHVFADLIHIKDEKEKYRVQLLALIHMLDHMQRLHERLDEDAVRAETVLFLNILDEPRIKLKRFVSVFSADDLSLIDTGS